MEDHEGEEIRKASKKEQQFTSIYYTKGTGRVPGSKRCGHPGGEFTYGSMPTP